MSTIDEAVNSLESVGLTEYEARCFVALTQLSKGTAKEVSQVADVPRSRVYDTIERLDRRGIVEVQRSEPAEYKAVPVEMAIRRIREDYDSRITAAENALQHVGKPEAQADEGMWSITHPDQVTDRITTFLDEAEETVHHLIAAEEVLTDVSTPIYSRRASGGSRSPVTIVGTDFGRKSRMQTSS